MHHANLLVGTREWARTCIPTQSEVAHPDVYVLEIDKMTLAHARELIRVAPLMPVLNTERICTVFCESLLPEAQNALLKIFEEPSAHTVFYMVVPHERVLLRTLRSRFFIIKEGVAQATSETISRATFDTFLKLPLHERLSEIQKRTEAKDDVWIGRLLAGIAASDSEINPQISRAELLSVGMYMQSPSSSRKMLLEHIALSL